MVRLEKIAWEKAVNTNLFGRAREIGLPHKFYRFSSFDHNLWLADLRINSPIGRLMAPLQKWWAEFNLKFLWDKYLKMGLSWEDKLVHTETDLRRDYFFEHVQRENFHPYHWFLKIVRRQRYFKVERTLPGFQVPDYIIDEVAQSTFAEGVMLEKQYTDFVHQNYESDFTYISTAPWSRRPSLWSTSCTTAC